MKTRACFPMLAVASGLLCAIPASPAAAQTGQAAPDMVQLEAVRISAQAEARSANRNVTVIDAQTLENEQAGNLEDMIRYIPGISIVDMGRFGDNGFNIRGLEGDRVAMTVDGLSFGETVETAVAYEFFRAGRGGLDVDTLKSVEVIKGADSITAGSGALSGGVAFTTKDPHDYLVTSGDDTHVGFKLGYTDASEETAATVTLANRSGIVESMLVYTQRDGRETDGWYASTPVDNGVARRVPDPVQRKSGNLLAKIDLVPAASHRFGLVYERSRADNDVNNLSRAEGAGYLRRLGDDSNDRDRYGLRYQWQADLAWFDNLEWTLDRVETESRGITRILTGSGTVGGLPCNASTPCWRSEDRATEQSLLRSALDLTRVLETAGLRHTLLYGLSWQQREVDFTAVDTRWNNLGEVVTVEIDPAQVPRTDVRTWNLYLRDAVSLLDDRLTLTAGLRYDRYDYSPRLTPEFQDATGTVRDASFSSPTWQLGAEYGLGARQSVWAQVGRGFRAPTVADMYAPTATTQLTVSGTGEIVTVPTSRNNPDLDSEKSLNIEIGYRWRTKRTRLDVSLFRDKYSDFIERINVTENQDVGYDICSSGTCTVRNGYTYTMPVNLGEVTVKGVELQGLWQFADHWLARLAASYNEGENRNGPLASINPANGVLGLQYRPSDRWNLTANVTHSMAKKREDVGASTSTFGSSVTPATIIDKASAYTVVDLFGSYRIVEGLRLSAGVYNLFDEEYYLWARVRGLSYTGATWGGVDDPAPGASPTGGSGIGRYSEPGRNYRVTLAYSF